MTLTSKLCRGGIVGKSDAQINLSLNKARVKLTDAGYERVINTQKRHIITEHLAWSLNPYDGYAQLFKTSIIPSKAQYCLWFL